MKRATLRALVALGATCASLICAATGVAAAAEGYVFDPVRSLTGSCKEEAVDPVPDPGLCPIPPGVAGVDHPPTPFSLPQGISTDSFGNLFVANTGTADDGSNSHVDIFDPEGVYISTVKVAGPVQIAVDSEGVLYVVQLTLSESGTNIRLSRIKPLVYEPAMEEIEYPDPATPEVIREKPGFQGATSASITVNPANDHIFLKLELKIVEYGSAAEGNPVLTEAIGEGSLQGGGGGSSIAIDATRNRLYAKDYLTASSEGVVRVFELSAPHALLDTITGAETPAKNGKFSIQPAIGVNEASGEVLVYNGGELAKASKSALVYGFEYDEAEDEYSYLGPPIGEGTSGGEGKINDIGRNAQIWVDNGASSPNPGYLFVPSHPSGLGHALAYGFAAEEEPEIEALSFAEVTRTDAELRATINAHNLPTDYTFEYTPQERYEEEGNSFAGAEVAGEGQFPPGKAGLAVSAAATGLVPETAYRFRVVATNDLGEVSAEDQFTTYPPAPLPPACANDALRTGHSALLPDCRAYELVTPPDTNARTPIGLSQLGAYFPSLQASPAGDAVSFQVQGGTIPGYEGGTGSLAGDPYLATRAAGGWTTVSSGPNGDEVEALLPGSSSPDQGYSIWSTGNPNGSRVIDGKRTNYVRYPDGHAELVGRGSVADDPRAEAKLISKGGGHILFISGTSSGPAIKLEENAPPSGTKAIYDRTADEVTHVVSLKPGDVTPTAGQDANYQGASYDGEGVAFTIGSTLYLRYNNEATFSIGSGLAFAGVAEGGRRIFYIQGGNLKAFDVEEGVISFTTSGDVTPVNVASGGTAAYFVSPSVLGSGANPNGAAPQAGKQNLYLSREGQISFVGTVTDRDVKGEATGNEQIEGLGLWTSAVTGFPGQDPSRTTADGGVLLFESRADLDGYDPEGQAQVYRYDSAAEELACLSCNPTGLPASGEASLQSLTQSLAGLEPLSSRNRLSNLTSGGRRAFFQSEEALVPEDTDGLQDVYEWEDQGVGSCTRPQGCIYLISSGQSERIDYLFAVSDSGEDVFFRTSDLLLGADADETPSVYDARVGGGFPDPEPQPCQETQVCRPDAPSPPSLPTPASNAVGASGNVASPKPKSCPKGKHKVKRNGKVSCVKNKPKKKSAKQRQRRHRAGTTGKGGHK